MTDAAPRNGDRDVRSREMNQGMQVLSILVAGIAAYGLLGGLGDHLLGTGFLLPIGLVVGAALGIYMIIRRFGTEPAGGNGPQTTTTKTKGRA